MSRHPAKGIPAASFFAGRSFHHQERQPLPIVPFAYAVALADIDDNDAGVLNPPVEIPPRREDDAISAVFAATRETIAELEAKRLENYGGDWSPAQMARAS